MKKKLLAVALLAASTGAMAQANNFEGFTAGVNVSSVGGTSTVNDGVGGTIDFGQQSLVPGVELGYNFAASSNIILGLTATYDFANSKLGQASDDDLGQVSLKGQNRMSINFKPGYVVAPNTMIYATVGYNSMSTKASFNAESESKTLNGIGYGLGLSMMVDKNVFVKAEIQQVNFNSWNIGDGASIKPNLTVGTIGIGYKF
jgi:opacity protein-like surface antigen